MQSSYQFVMFFDKVFFCHLLKVASEKCHFGHPLNFNGCHLHRIACNAITLHMIGALQLGLQITHL